MTIASRRRALMGAKKEEPNGIVPGNVASGTSNIIVNADGNVVLTAFNQGWQNEMKLPFKKAITVSTNDTVRLVCTNVSGSASGCFVDIWMGGWQIVSNKTFFLDGNTILDSSITREGATADFNFLRIRARNGNTSGDVTFSVQIYVNGEAQFA